MDSCIRISDEEKGVSSKLFCIPKQYENDVDTVLIPYGIIQDRIEKLASDVFHDLHEDEMTFLCVLKGGYRFFSDLSDKLSVICRATQRPITINIEFIRLKSYTNDESSGIVQVEDIRHLSSLQNKNVLVIEDIIDTGLTIVKLLSVLKDLQVKSVRVASLLVKRTTRSNGYRPEYIGFEVPDHFLIGYALDYNERFRDLNHICILNEKGREKYAKLK
jgi:hypoxanthine phosphoribosyltransferase